MIQHTLELTESGYRLVIWESAPQTSSRVNPFFFRATYWLSSPSKASEILKMVKGEQEIIFSQTMHQAINEKRQQDSCKSLTNRVSVAFQT
jgi:hypothetical protein